MEQAHSGGEAPAPPGGPATGPAATPRTAWDTVAEELLALRVQAGQPSFGVLAQLVSERRVAAGATPEAARIARSTVHDYFRLGRTRGSLPLARELAAVLGGDPREVDGWLTRRPAAPEPTPPEPGTAPDATPAVAWRLGVGAALLLLVACVVVNLAGRWVVEALALPVYLDMVGTAVAAVALGPWRGALVGLVTNVLGVLVSGPASLPFALVNVVGALVWGYGVHRLRMGRTLPRFFVLNLLVALACSVVAVPILTELFAGSTGHAEDGLAARLASVGHSALLSLGLANLLASVADKVVSGFVALVAVATLPLDWRRTVPLAVVVDPDAGGPAQAS